LKIVSYKNSLELYEIETLDKPQVVLKNFVVMKVPYWNFERESISLFREVESNQFRSDLKGETNCPKNTKVRFWHWESAG